MCCVPSCVSTKHVLIYRAHFIFGGTDLDVVLVVWFFGIFQRFSSSHHTFPTLVYNMFTCQVQPKRCTWSKITINMNTIFVGKFFKWMPHGRKKLHKMICFFAGLYFVLFDQQIWPPYFELAFLGIAIYHGNKNNTVIYLLPPRAGHINFVRTPPTCTLSKYMKRRETGYSCDGRRSYWCRSLWCDVRTESICHDKQWKWKLDPCTGKAMEDLLKFLALAVYCAVPYVEIM